MSLFGLFHVAFGIAAVTKDAISDSISDTVNREKAKDAGREMYYVNGRSPKSTKTGMPAYMDYGFNKYDHVCVRDSKTRQVVEDVTIKMNAQNQIIEKQKAKDRGSVFYRTTEYDTSIHHRSGVYVSDVIPGYFRLSTYNNYTVYEEGKLVKAPSWSSCPYEVEVPIQWERGHKTYYEDGSVCKEDVLMELKHNILLDYRLKDGYITQEQYDAAVEKEKHYKGIKTYKKGEQFI